MTPIPFPLVVAGRIESCTSQGERRELGMARNVYVIDKRLHANQQDLMQEIRESRNTPGSFPNEVITVNQNLSMEQICLRVIARSGGEIGVLRIVCHGNASSLQLGTGVQTPNHVWNFRLLRGHWVGRYPRIELHACGVASATRLACTIVDFPDTETALAQLATACTRGTANPNSAGHALCQALADSAGIPVVASYDVQLGPQPSGLEGRIHYFIPAQYFRRDGVNPLAA
jgi:hypothetical protein